GGGPPGAAPRVGGAPFEPPSAPAQVLLQLEVTSVPQPGGPTVADLAADLDPNRKPHPTVPLIGAPADLGQGAPAPNGPLQRRGHSGRQSRQKSYTIKLFDEAPAWRGTHTIQLNKHPYDLTRLRKELSFDLVAALPEMSSPRPAFVQVRIDGQDQGLFPQI